MTSLVFAKHTKDGLRARRDARGPKPSGSVASLNGGKRRWYKHTMLTIGELGCRGLPRTIPAEDLQKMLRANPAFCSWNASNSPFSELMDRWPFLLSHLP